MRMSYYFGKEITEESTMDFLYFLNDCNRSGCECIDIYMASVGGDLSCYYAIKEALEVSEIPIHLKCTGMLASAAFMLFYFTEGILKSMTRNSFALIHLATTSLDNRELRKENSFDGYSKKGLDTINAELLEEYKTNKVLTATQLKSIEKGEDVVLLYNDFYKIMGKCKFGTFLKEGEQVIFQE